MLCVLRLCRCRVDVDIHVQCAPGPEICHQKWFWSQRFAIRNCTVGLPSIIVKFAWFNLDGEIVQQIQIALVAIPLWNFKIKACFVGNCGTSVVRVQTIFKLSASQNWEEHFAVKFNAKPLNNNSNCYGNLMANSMTQFPKPHLFLVDRQHQMSIVDSLRASSARFWLDYLWPFNRSSKFIPITDSIEFYAFFSHTDNFESASIVATQQVGDSCSGFPFSILTSASVLFRGRCAANDIGISLKPKHTHSWPGVRIYLFYYYYSSSGVAVCHTIRVYNRISVRNYSTWRVQVLPHTNFINGNVRRARFHFSHFSHFSVFSFSRFLCVYSAKQAFIACRGWYEWSVCASVFVTPEKLVGIHTHGDCNQRLCEMCTIERQGPNGRASSVAQILF